MLTEIYIAALLVDEELADQVWVAWDKGEIDDQVAWWCIFQRPPTYREHCDQTHQTIEVDEQSTSSVEIYWSCTQ